MWETMGSVISFIFVAVLIIFFLGILAITVYYTTYGFWERLRWKLRRKKSEHIRAVSLPIGNINQNSLEDTTRELNRRIHMRISGDMPKLRTITMSTDKAGNCYVTAWYMEKRVGYVEESFSQSYNDPMANWQL